MTRPIICVILMVVFVLGMVAKETQGENTCHTNISYGNEGCESMVCSLDCATNWKGFGECVSTKSPNCICAYPCPN
ncbi:unnamed protein product [Brassica rapa]|uniref:Uncharacterized protein n=2 Tax=Brassica TaxID=3705 RepID=A0A8D9I0Z4_BRACM|nr:unnamed protein product [Brassica napus]CAG7907249.1 unnamed protein product [Brassica rapa]CDY35324.1 BnaA04g15230D [Brassica napus]